MPGEPATDGSAEMEEVLTVLSGSGALDLLGMTDDDLQVARKDSELFVESLRQGRMETSIVALQQSPLGR